MKIKFVRGHKVQQHDGNGTVYEEGKVYDFDGFVAETYARKYIARGYAVEYVEPKVTQAKLPDPVAVSAKPAFVADVVADPVPPPDASDVKFGFRRGPGRPRKE